MFDPSKLPIGWQVRKLPEVLEFLPGKAHEPYIADGGEYTVANSKFVSTRGSVRKFATKNVSPAVTGDVLVVMSDLPNGRALGKAYLVAEGEKIAVNQRVCALRTKYGEPAFYYYQLDRSKYFLSFNDGINQTHLLNPVFENCPIVVAPLAEQRKIAAILRTWDEALEKLQTLRTLKAKRLEGLAQRLLGRGGVFPGKWSLMPLSEIATRVRRQNGGGNHPVMTISARSGFLMQSDKFARDMAGTSVDRYTLLHEGEFAYNKGNSLAALYGCIYRLDRPTALVPFVYFCFALKPEHDHGFYEHLFAAGALNHQLSRLINSGVRNDGLLNLNVEDFFGCKIPVPPLDEQRRIALALSAAKQELALLDKEIIVLTRQKRGLMQKLLTGEWPVQVEDAA